MCIINFISKKEFFNKEISGVKNNTVRIISNRHDFDGLKEGKYNKIRITSEDHSNIIFTKKITDISIHDNICIITWKHDS